MISTDYISEKIEDCRNGIEYCKCKIETNKLSECEVKEYNDVIKEYVNELAELLSQLDLVESMLWDKKRI